MSGESLRGPANSSTRARPVAHGRTCSRFESGVAAFSQGPSRGTCMATSGPRCAAKRASSGHGDQRGVRQASEVVCAARLSATLDGMGGLGARRRMRLVTAGFVLAIAALMLFLGPARAQAASFTRAFTDDVWFRN